MLKGIDSVINAELIHALMLMGHGDDLVVCDLNHPAQTIAKHTTYAKIIDVSGCELPRAIEAILKLFPLDTFVDAPVTRMRVVGDPDKQVPIFGVIQKVLDRMQGSPVKMQAVERFAFYDTAKKSFAIVRTSDPGPYRCFILNMGVV